MCFKIDDSAERPKIKRVYKVVQIRGDGTVISPFKNFVWNERTIARTSGGAYQEEGKAKYGFYVLLNREDAEAAVRGCPELTILELDVNPKHWLYTSDKAGAIARRCYQHPRGLDCPNAITATYRVVRAAKQQRYLTWTR